MPEPELVDDDTRAPELHDDCTRALIERDAPPEVDLEATLRASTDGPGARALATALTRPFDAEHVPGAWRMPLDECKARAAAALARNPATTEREELDPHERRRFTVAQPRTRAPRLVSAGASRGTP